MHDYKLKLLDLFEEWEKCNIKYLGKFVKDGIIDIDLYQRSNLKILFILKEANDPTQNSWDLTDTLRNEFKGNFTNRLAEWAYGILNNFPPLNLLPDAHELHRALKSTSILNLKKTGGTSTSKVEEIIAHVKQDKEFILREIEIINPDVIVGGVGTKEKGEIWKILFPNIMLTSSGYDIVIGKWNEMKLVDFYHPSYRGPRAMSYALLQNIFRSQTFREL